MSIGDTSRLGTPARESAASGARPEATPVDAGWKLTAESLTVTVLCAEPPGSGVTAAGTKAQAVSAGRPVQARPTSEEKPLNEVTLQTELAELPCTIASDDGLQPRMKSGSVDGVGVTWTQLLTGLWQAAEAPRATTL